MKDVVDYIKSNEGLRLDPYRDTTGHWTIGYGHNCGQSVPGSWNQEQADVAFQRDFITAILALHIDHPWAENLTLNRWMALVDMTFNMGRNTVRGFVSFLTMMEHGHYEDAAKDLMLTAYARELPARAKRNAELITNG